MSCYHPMLASFVGYSSDTGKPQYKLSGNSDVPKRDPRDKLVPCGHCIGCKLDKSRQWANRCMAELDHSKKACFVTLTYDDMHVPIAYFTDDGVPIHTLNKKHLQDFLKRLRYYFTGTEIRFYACGEYGKSTFRPHFHIILFGIDIFDFPDSVQFGSNKAGQPYFSSDKLNKIWSFGFTSLAPVSWQTCAYVARYTAKGGLSDSFCDSIGISRQFTQMSRRPGIGGYYAIEHPDSLKEPKLYFDDPHGLKSVTSCDMPKFIFDKLELTNPDLYIMIKEQRARAASVSFNSMLKNTDLDQFEQLHIMEQKKISRTKNLLNCRKEL